MIQKSKLTLLIIITTSLTLAADIQYTESECRKMLDDFYTLCSTFENQRQTYIDLKNKSLEYDQEYKKAEELWKKVLFSKYYLEKHCNREITLKFE